MSLPAPKRARKGSRVISGEVTGPGALDDMTVDKKEGE
jgi:hypothetical protein